MAITQERMRAVLQAAEIYQDHYTTIVDVLVLLHQMMREGAITPAAAMERLFSQFGDKKLPIEAAGVIEAERRQYRLTCKRNDYMREYQRAKRGTTPKASTPLLAPRHGASRAPSGAPSPYDDAAANAMSRGAGRAPSDDISANAMSRAPCGAPSDAASANAMSLAEIEAAIARASASAAPSDDASGDAAPSSAAATNPPNNAESSIAFNAELSVDDLL